MKLKTNLATSEMLKAICSVMYDGNWSAFGRALGSSPSAMNSRVKRGTFPSDILFKNVEKQTEDGVVRLNPIWLLTGKGEMTCLDGKCTKEPTDAELCLMCDQRGLHKDADGRWVKTQSVLIEQDVPIG